MIHIKHRLEVSQATYIGIIMPISLTLHKLFRLQWVGKVKVANFTVNIKDEYYQKQTSWWFYVFGSKMRTKNDWDAVEPILELLMFGELEQRVEVSNFCKLQNPDPLFWIDSLNNGMTHSIDAYFKESLHNCYYIIENNYVLKLTEHILEGITIQGIYNTV